METTKGKVRDLKPGRYVVIDGEPCKVVNIDISKPGKHGAAKARVEAVSLFTGTKKSLLKSADADVEIPIVKKKKGQVIAKLGGKRIQIMDLETYEVFEEECPDEFLDKIEAGVEIEYQEVLGKRLITRVAK